MFFFFFFKHFGRKDDESEENQKNAYENFRLSAMTFSLI